MESKIFRDDCVSPKRAKFQEEIEENVNPSAISLNLMHIRPAHVFLLGTCLRFKNLLATVDFY